MNNLKPFCSFVNESYESSEERIREIRRRIEAKNPEEQMYQTVYDEGGAAKRLLGRAVNALTGVSRSIADVFKKDNLASMDDKSLENSKDEVLSKWGEGIKVEGKNKKKDYEEFYTNALIKGRKTFGRGFDLKNPKSREEKIYAEYISGADKYFDL